MKCYDGIINMFSLHIRALQINLDFKYHIYACKTQTNSSKFICTSHLQ